MMKKQEENNYFMVTYEKELADSKKLAEKIKGSGWVSSSMILVNCSPDYSSRLTQMINHKLSHLNHNELYECIDLELPYPIMSQVWNPADKAYQSFDKYLLDWVRMNLNTHFNYLFLDSGKPRERTLTKVRSAVRSKLEPDHYRFASLYSPDGAQDFYIDKITGPLVFQWENMNNPNW